MGYGLTMETLAREFPVPVLREQWLTLGVTIVRFHPDIETDPMDPEIYKSTCRSLGGADSGRIAYASLTGRDEGRSGNSVCCQIPGHWG